MKRWFARGLSSLQARLLLLLLLVLMAPLGLLIHTAGVQRVAGLREAEADAIRLSELAATEHQQIVESGHQVLEALAEMPAVRGLDAVGCSETAARLLEKRSLYANIAAALPDGGVFCSGVPLARATRWSEQSWFQQVVQGQMLGGDYQFDPVTNTPTLTLAHPVLDESGRLRAVATVSLKLDWLARYAAGSSPHSHGNLAILGADGRILVGFPEPERWAGRRDTSGTFARAQQVGLVPGTVEGTGVDGTRQLYAFARLRDDLGGQPRYLRLSIPTAVAYAEANRKLVHNLVLLAATAAAALAGGWSVTRVLLLRPLQSLMGATNQLRIGNLAARAGPPYASGQLGELAHAFDNMVAALAAREGERLRAAAEARSATQRELQRYAEEASTLYGVSAAVARTIEPHGLLSEVLEMVLRSVGADAGWVLVAEGVIGPQRCVPVWKGVSEQFPATEVLISPEACSVCEEMLKSGQQYSEPRLIYTCPRLPAAVLSGAAAPCHLGVPLKSTDRVLGILNIVWREPHEVTQAERNLLTTIGRQVSVALEKAEMYAAATQRARRLATMNKIGQALSASLDLDCVLDALLESVTQAVQASGAGVALPATSTTSSEVELGLTPGDRGARVLVFRKAAGAGAEQLLGLCISAEEGLTLQALSERKPVFLADATGVQGLSPWECDRLAEGVVICVPLIVHERLIGMLELSRGGSDSPEDEDLQLLRAVAGQAAVAIEHALLYAKEREEYRRLEEAQAQLVQAEKSAALGRLAAALAHEINNPLQSLRGHIDLVIDFPLPPEERAKYLGVARQEIVRLGEIAHRVLNFYRPSQAVRQPVQINQLVADTVQLAAKQVEHARIELSLELADLPPVMAVPDQLMQVFLNLLINAIQAVEKSGQIAIITSVLPNEVLVSFANDGPPIPPEHLPRIFDPFFTTKTSGTGLGLSVGHSIIHEHGGTITAENRMGGRGVIFTVRLPAAVPTKTLSKE